VATQGSHFFFEYPQSWTVWVCAILGNDSIEAVLKSRFMGGLLQGLLGLARESSFGRKGDMEGFKGLILEVLASAWMKNKPSKGCK
jgi:hypothetical protein